jgi:hypothetical protein
LESGTLLCGLALFTAVRFEVRKRQEGGNERTCLTALRFPPGRGKKSKC